MSAALAAMVQETSLTQGLNDLTLNGAVPGYRTFLTAFGDGGICHYTILWGTHWEYGIGTIDVIVFTTLIRNIVIASSTGGDKLNLGSGTKLVYCEPGPGCFNSAGWYDFDDGDTQPSVKKGNLFIAVNSGATSITNFIDGVPGQELAVICLNGNTTFVHGTTLKHPGATNITPTTNDVISYVLVNGIWQRAAFSQNS